MSLNGHPVDVMLDTGASQHFVLDAAAWAYDVPSQPFESYATDAHGTRFPVRLAAEGVMRIPGRPLFTPQHLFLLSNEPLVARGLLGGLAPQLLAPPGHATILDLAAGRLDVRSNLSLSNEDRATLGRVCRAGNDSRDGWRYVVPVRVDGRTTWLLLDTGAQSSTVYERTAHAPRLLERGVSQVVRAAGAASTSELRIVDAIPFELGGATLENRVAVGRGDPQCGEEGLLGFDVLRHCRLVMRQDGLSLACQSEEPEVHRAPPRMREQPILLAGIATDPACGRSADELRPAIRGSIPRPYRSALDAYVDLREGAGAHALSIERTCRDSGYLEAEVREPLLERRGAWVSLRFHVEEGRRFVVGRVSVSVHGIDGARRLATTRFPFLRTREGQPYQQVDIEEDARALTDLFTSRGADVAQALLARDQNDDATVDVHFALALESPLPQVADLEAR